MATDDGTPTRDEATPPDGPDPVTGRRDAGAEPTELPSDWPGPVSWGATLGAGGEVIADPAELVPLTGRGAEKPSEEPGGTGARRRAPRRPQFDAQGGDSRRRRASTGMPSLNTLVAAGGAVGLAGLAGLLVAVLFFGGGIPAPVPDDRGDGVAAVAEVTTDRGRTAAPPAPRASTNTKVTERRAAERAARRARQRDRTPQRQAPPESAGTTQVEVSRPPAPSPAPAPAPAHSVSPAEREFTPGPWNLS